MKKISTAIFVFIFYICSGQKASDPQNSRLEMEARYDSVHAVILSDSIQIEMVDDKTLSTTYRFQSLNNFHQRALSGTSFICRHERIRFLTQKGIDENSKITLPPCFDPAWENRNLPVAYRDSLFRPKGDYESFNFIDVLVLHANGVSEKAKLEKKIQKEVLTFNGSTQTFQANQYRIANLIPGDEVDINYSVRNVPVGNRVFLHGSIPKQSMVLTFRYCNPELFILTQKNGLQYTDSVVDGRFTTFTWKMNHWEGCIDEPGARPFKELPFFYFYYHNQDYGRVNSKNMTIDTILPYNWPAILLANVTYDDPKLKDWDVDSKQSSNIALRNFVATVPESTSDSTGHFRFKKLHDIVTDDFDYQQDSLWVGGGDQRNERLDEFINKHTLREISRIRFYTRLIESSGKLRYFLCYLHDHRTEEISFDKYNPTISDRKAFVTTYEGHPFYYLPKSHRFGLYQNELPFYFEDEPVVLIPQNELEDKAYRNAPNVNFQMITTPFSTQKDNRRITSVLANVTADGQVKFDCRLQLTGQFSTMTRGCYLFNYYDSTINLRYMHKIYDINASSKLDSLECLEKSTQYPYTFKFRMHYSADNIVTKDAIGYSVNLKDLFGHIIEEKLTNHKRQLAYFPDFLYTDKYTYYFKFPQPVSCSEAAALEQKMAGEWGSFSFVVSQPSPDVLLVTSELDLAQEMIPAANVEQLENAFRAIAHLNQVKVHLK
jgi:hypothetical protein